MNAEQDKLVLSLTGRIDTNNAAQVEKELMTRLADHPGKTVVSVG